MLITKKDDGFMLVWRWLKRSLFFILVGIVTIWLDFSLPNGRIVHVVGTDVKRMSKTVDGKELTRDVYFVSADNISDGQTYVYRNEDAWLYLFKVNSADIQGRAHSLVQSQDKTPALLRYYGYRLQLFSVFPNILTLEAVDGGHQYVPYLRYLAFTLWGFVSFFVGFRWRHLIFD